MGMKRVLIVCTGNICRSPMAEGFMRQLLRERKIDGISVTSAGLSAISGSPVVDRAALAALEEGVDIGSHRSRALTEEMVAAADFILVMDHSHRRALAEWYPYARSKVFLLGSFRDGNLDDVDIHDPYGPNMDEFRKCFLIIQQSVKGFLRFLERGEPRPEGEK